MNATPLILSTASASSLLQAALLYEKAGISVLPCRGKEPALKHWRQLQECPASAETIGRWNQTGLLQNVGVICGHVSGNLVVVDCDGLDAVDAYSRRFAPVLTDTYTVRSGSGQGAHFYYYVELLPPSTRVVGAPFGNVELRADGSYVVAPPSIHPNGKRYAILNHAPIARVQHLRGVVEWIQDARQKNSSPLPTPTGAAAPVRSATAFGRAALAGEEANVRMASPGARNDTLNRAAFKLGQLVAKGQLDRADVENRLYQAAAQLAQSDGDMSVLRTIKSGLDAGMTKPPLYREALK